MDAGETGLERTLEAAGWQCTQRRINELSQTYERSRDLRTLHTPSNILNGAPKGVERWLRLALRMERAKALNGHWSYSANRHMLLYAALRREKSARLH